MWDDIFEKKFNSNNVSAEKQREKLRKQLQKQGFLSMNENYSTTMHVQQEYVEENPTQFIIPECIPACKELWSKNIDTFMVSDYYVVADCLCWIEIRYDLLSEENKTVYKNLKAVKFSYHEKCVNFGVNYAGKKGQQKLLELAKKFKMQDVIEGVAYLKPRDFLMEYCGCYEEYPNPEYEYMDLSSVRGAEELKKYYAWEDSIKSQKTLKRFSPDKVVKSISEYAQEHGLILGDNRIYLSDFYYKKHLNFVAYEASLNF